MQLLKLLRPEMFRKIVTEYYQAEAKLVNLMPVEKYKSELVQYDIQKTIAVTPGIIAPGAGFPMSMGTYEVGDATLELYGVGIEIHKHDVDWRRINVLRREIEQKSVGMALYRDLKISTALDAVTANTISGSSWATAPNSITNIVKAIRYIEEDNVPGGATDLICDPLSHSNLLRNLTITAETQLIPGIVKGNRVTNYLGLNVVVSNNLKTPTSAFVVAKNKFGWLPEAYPLSTLPPELVRELMVYRAYLYAMDAVVIDQENAVCEITSVNP